MSGWAGVALALRGVGDDAMASRLPTYLHPLSGRALGWHTLRAISLMDPSPTQIFLPIAGPHADALVSGLSADPLELEAADAWWPEVARRLEPDVERVLVVDAAAATLAGSLAGLVSGPAGVALRNDRGRVLAVWLERDQVERCAAAGRSLDALVESCAESRQVDADEGVIVWGRADLAQAGRILRERIVRRLMLRGATFLLPESVVVDVDVSIGRDTLVYPGVVLEGETRIGEEAVIGPGCRIVDSRIGDGVELKGWNYIVRASIRNRAVLEPYVRRGYD